ncbi:MAG TPA: AraC family transcriptional regulator [Deltaproteobacteria bacterium]|nr:AraC family transcriptional regulator [Deltaproteobacteria bacterium]
MPDVALRIMLEVLTFGVGFSLVFAIAQVCRKNPDQLSYLNFLVFLGNSIIQLVVVLKVRNVILEYPLASFLSLSAIFFIGPANYLYHHILLNPIKAVPVKVKLQFAPAAAALIFEILFQLQPSGVKKHSLAELFTSPLQHWFTVVLASGAIFTLVYFLIMFRLGLTVLKNDTIRAQVMLILTAFFSTLVAIVLLSLGFLLGSDPMLLMGGTIITLINISIFLSNMRYPNFYHLIEKELKKNKYERSLLKGLDTEVVYDRLTYLMGEEKIYKDFDLSLEGLAKMLCITPHQLSQFMNERLTTNFRNYINSYRIEEAKKILISESDKNILAICYDVGFNSKSTFNQCFKKYTNKTPSEFRLEHQSGDKIGPDL